MWHFRAKRLLSAYLDRALDGQMGVQIGVHSEHCEKCHQALEEIERSSRLAELARRAVDDRALTRVSESLGQCSPRTQELRNLQAI